MHFTSTCVTSLEGSFLVALVALVPAHHRHRISQGGAPGLNDLDLANEVDVAGAVLLQDVLHVVGPGRDAIRSLARAKFIILLLPVGPGD